MARLYAWFKFQIPTSILISGVEVRGEFWKSGAWAI